MDLRLSPDASTPTERDTVDAVLEGLGTEGTTTALREARGLRHLLLPTLRAIQARFGWITPGAFHYACERLHIPPAEAYGVATFYALFSMTEKPPVTVHLCDDVACLDVGGDTLAQTLTQQGESVHRSPCLGLCDQAPAALLVAAGPNPVERAIAHATADTVRAALANPQHAIADAVSKIYAHGDARLSARIGRIDPTSFDDYRAHGGFVALRSALDRGPAWLLREMSDAGLSGRGGAAFPTGRKWEAVARALTRPRHLVCNADESEPGTFKDRVLMEGDPFALIESMVIAGLAMGAEHGWIYLRAEYPLAHARLKNAIAACRARGLLGNDIMQRGLRFDIELRRGAGAYICGEESALLNSLEGFRGEPRTRPPFPVESGLFGQPTAIHNVETLMNVPWIVREGAAAFRSVGTRDSPGTRLFSVSGAVERPGVYEIAHGMTLQALLALAGARPLRAVLLGGAAGSFVAPDDFALPLTLEDTRKASVTLGSGVVLALDASVDLEAMLVRMAKFFRDESCGQCVPCRVGTVRQHELVTRLARRTPHGSIEAELDTFRDLACCMRDASICGLGHTAANAIESAMTRLGVWKEPRP